MGARVVTIGGTGLYQNYLSAGLIIVSNPPSIDNFQEWVTIPWCPGMALDFSNIRFAQADDTPVLAHRFSYTSMGSAVFWLRVPDAGTREIYFYFDGGDMTDILSTGAEVFNQYNQFATSGTNLKNTVFPEQFPFDPATGAYDTDTAVSYSDPCTADLTAQYATVSGTAIAFDTNHYHLVANTDSKYRLKSYQHKSGQHLFKFTLPASCNDGDYINMRFCSTGDLSKGYGVGAIRTSGAWNVYTVLDTTGTDTTTVITGLADGDSFYVKVRRDSERGYHEGTVYETTDPGTPQVTVYNASYSYGYCGIVVHSASGSKTFELNSVELRTNLLVGETNVPATNPVWNELTIVPNNGVTSVFITPDEMPRSRGDSWSEIQRLGSETRVYSLANLGSGVVLAGTGLAGKIFKSTDSGSSWSEIQRLGGETYIYSLANLGSGVVLAGTGTTGKIFKSTDSGDSWSEIQQLGSETRVYSLANLGSGVVLAGTGLAGKIFKSTDSGSSWSEIQRLGGETYICSLANLGSGVVLAGTYPTGKIFKSTDSGSSWSEIQRLGGETYIYSLANLGSGVVLAGTYPTGKIFKSTDSGSSWSGIQRLGSETYIYSLANLGSGVVLAGTYPTGKIFKSTDSGSSWSEIQRLGSEAHIYSLANLGSGVVLAGTGLTGKIFKSISTNFKPMLRGAGIGQYYDGSSTVNATRISWDCNADNSAEFTPVGGAATWDTTNGQVTFASANDGIKPTGISPATQVVIAKISTTSTSNYNAITLLDDGNDGGSFASLTAGTKYVVYRTSTTNLRLSKVVAGTATTVKDCTIPTVSANAVNEVMIVYLAASGSFLIYWNGALVGTTTDTSITTANPTGFGVAGFSSGTVKYHYMAIIYPESTATNGVCRTHGSVSHGNLWSTGITAGYLMREYESTDPTLTEVARMPNPFAPRRVPTDGNRAIEAKVKIGIATSAKFGHEIKANPKVGIATSVKFGHEIKANPKVGIAVSVPKIDITSWVTAQYFRRATIHRGIQDKYATASFWFDGQPDWWFYDKQIRYDMPDYLGTEYPVFIGEAPDSDDTLAPAEDGFVLKAVDPGANLSEPLSQDQLVMPSTTNPGEYIRDLLGGMFDWQKTSGIFPGMVQDVTGWGSTITAFEKVFPEGTTKREAITFFEGQLNYIFDVRQKSYGGSYLPTGYFCDFTNIDSATVGLDLLSEVTFTYPSAFVGKPIQRKRSGTQKYNRIYIRCQALTSSTWYESELKTPACAAGDERPKTYPPGSAVEKEIFTQADLDARAASYYAYYCGDIGDKITTWIVVLYDRPDIQRMQKVKFTGFSLGTEFDGVSMRVVDITYDHGIDDAGDPVNSTTIQIIPDADFQLQNQISRLDPGRYSKMEDMIRKMVTQEGTDEQLGTVIQ